MSWCLNRKQRPRQHSRTAKTRRCESRALPQTQIHLPVQLIRYRHHHPKIKTRRRRKEKNKKLKSLQSPPNLSRDCKTKAPHATWTACCRRSTWHPTSAKWSTSSSKWSCAEPINTFINNFELTNYFARLHYSYDPSINSDKKDCILYQMQKLFATL